MKRLVKMTTRKGMVTLRPSSNVSLILVTLLTEGDDFRQEKKYH